MKKNRVLRITVAIFFAALMSFGSAFGQSSARSGAGTETVMQRLESILNCPIPPEIYPPGYFDTLLGMSPDALFPSPPWDSTNEPHIATIRYLTPGDKADMVIVQPASFTMGSPSTEAERNSDEIAHSVTISSRFYIGKYEITQHEYQSIVGNNPSWFTSANGYDDDLNRPVETVTWLQASNYCYLLTQQELANGHIQSGWAYRLPTEAEWEYSCRSKLAGKPANPTILATQPDYSTAGTMLYSGNAFNIWPVGTMRTTTAGTVTGADIYLLSDGGGCYYVFNTSFTAIATYTCMTSPVNNYVLHLSFPAGATTSVGDQWVIEANDYNPGAMFWGDSAGVPYLSITGVPQNPSDNSAFSFGNTLHGGMINFDDHYEYDASIGTITVGSPIIPSLNMTTNIGSYSANPYGLYDMHGNVSEWCQDWYDTYPTSTTVDPQGPTTGTLRIVRGGSWYDAGISCRSAARTNASPSAASSHIGFRIVLAPTTAEWKTAVTTTPTQMTYGNYPTKQSGKDNLIVITHGWILKATSPFFPFYQSWVNDMSNNVVTYLNAHNMNDWQVYGYHWEDNAWKLQAQVALYNAKSEGVNLGSAISVQGWNHVHLIGHSAGTELIQEASRWIKTVSPSTTVQCTFLDAYVGEDNAGVANYGNVADWSDSYFSHDVTGDVTEQPLVNAYNVNVTQLGPKQGITKFRSQTTGQMEVCTHTIKYHGWPIDFYTNTITGNVDSNYEGFGFPLSKEGGGWSSGIPNYTRGNGAPGHSESVRKLGTDDPSCVNDIHIDPPTWSNLIPNFTALPTVESSTGSNQKGTGVLNLTPGSPSWVSTIITFTNSLNTLTFDAMFSGVTNSEDMLSVIWDADTIGSVDERIVQPGLQHYSLKFSNATANSTHILSFRLDPYTSAKSSIILTNIALTQVGPALPFILSATTNTVNGLMVWQLTGESGYAYGIQASTNLSSTDWTDIAELVNTNGVVQFYDQDSTNYPMRFYRAYVPTKQ